MRILGLLAITVLLLTGCSGGSDEPLGPDGSDNGSRTTTAKPSGPACGDIWQAGETLPDNYTSCVLDGAVAPQEVYQCSDESKLVAFNDSMYAVTGGVIVAPDVAPMQDTEEYGKAYAECTGE